MTSFVSINQFDYSWMYLKKKQRLTIYLKKSLFTQTKWLK